MDTTGKKIIVIDDEKIVRELTGEMLKRLGYEPLLFDSAIPAIAYYTGNWKNISLVLLDMIMPEMGGLEAFKKLKYINPDIRTIILSGYCLENESMELQNAGISDFIQKPVSMALLKEKIRNVLDFSSAEKTELTGTECEVPVIQGVDAETAVRFLDGDVELYYKLIERFKIHYSDAAEEIKNRYISREYDWIYTAAHSLKSLAGSLGAFRLAESAEKVESAVKESNYTALEMLISSLADEIVFLVGVLQDMPLLPHQNNTAVKDTIKNPETVSSSLKKLKEALTIHSPKNSRNMINDIKILKIDDKNMEKILEIEKAVSVYDFKKAKEIFKDIKHDMI